MLLQYLLDILSSLNHFISQHEELPSVDQDKAVNSFKSTGLSTEMSLTVKILIISILIAPWSQAMRLPNDHVPYSYTSSDSPQFYSSKSPDIVIPKIPSRRDIASTYKKNQKSNTEAGKLDLLL
ncbi:hypothetical protein TNCV_5441 [Trichonephila clavipes]|nr:hypothetical protein TNCV_5441 [Trichonephila clavipes]